MSYTYTYPRPALTVDAVVFRQSLKNVEVLLIKRKNEPFKGMWALPGGFVDINETLEMSVQRELLEETGLKNIELHQLHAFSAIDRDPRGRTISIIFWGVDTNHLAAIAGDDAAAAEWFSADKLPDLAFDHLEAVVMALKCLEKKINH